MSYTDSLRLTPRQLQRLFKSSSATSMQPGIPHQPGPGDIPRSWGQTLFPPGYPLVPMGANAQPGYRQHPQTEPRTQSRVLETRPIMVNGQRQYEVLTDTDQYYTDAGEQVAQFTPRRFSFPPAINTTITPRVGYGHMSFADIQALSESTADVQLCWKLPKKEFSGLNPKVAHKDGEECGDESFQSFALRPDRYHSMGAWLSRWFQNVIIYGAPTLFMPRDRNGFITGLVNVDGTTIFTLIDENADPPKPPAPAYLQIIYGVPYGFASTEQLWYKPSDLHLNSEYGWALVESAYLPALLLNNLWKYRSSFYQTGTLPDAAFEAPPGWTNEQVAAWLITKNQALAGNPELRTQFDVWPSGFKVLLQKALEVGKDKELADMCKNELMEHAGIPVAEAGQVQGGGSMGSRGFMDVMSQQIFRKTFLPHMRMASEPFNEVFAINHQTCSDGVSFHEMVWDFPKESIDPEKERTKIIEDFQNGGMSLGEYREAIGKERYKDERDDLIYLKGGAFIAPDGSIWANAKAEDPLDGDPNAQQFPGVDVPRQLKPVNPDAQPGREPGQPPPSAADAPDNAVAKATVGVVPSGLNAEMRQWMSEWIDLAIKV